MAQLSDRVVVKPNVIFRALGNEAVILNLDSGVYFGLNEVGTRVWQLLEERNVQQACERLRGEFEAPAERIERDVLTLVDAMVAKGLVECRAS